MGANGVFGHPAYNLCILLLTSALVHASQQRGQSDNNKQLYEKELLDTWSNEWTDYQNDEFQVVAIRHTKGDHKRQKKTDGANPKFTRNLRDQIEHFYFTGFGRHFHLKTKQNDNLLAPNFSAYHNSPAGTIEALKKMAVDTSCHHLVGHLIDSAQTPSIVALTQCASQGMSGYIRTNVEDFFLEPLKNASSSKEYRLYRKVREKYKILQHPEQQRTSSSSRKRRSTLFGGRPRSSGPPSKIVEILLVLDQSMLQRYGYPAASRLALTVFNMVSAMYSDGSIGYPVRLVLVALLLLEHEQVMHPSEECVKVSAAAALVKTPDCQQHTRSPTKSDIIWECLMMAMTMTALPTVERLWLLHSRPSTDTFLGPNAAKGIYKSFFSQNDQAAWTTIHRANCSYFCLPCFQANCMMLMLNVDFSLDQNRMFVRLILLRVYARLYGVSMGAANVNQNSFLLQREPPVVQQSGAGWDSVSLRKAQVLLPLMANGQHGRHGQFVLAAAVAELAKETGSVTIPSRAQYGGHYCIGNSTEYYLCNPQQCTGHPIDVRELQCSSFNSKPFRGNFYTWTSYTNGLSGNARCKLYCQASGWNFVALLSEKVLDGAFCETVWSSSFYYHQHGKQQAASNDRCVEGRCRKVGCDGRLDSETKLDSCGVCGGDDASCRNLKGSQQDIYQRHFPSPFSQLASVHAQGNEAGKKVVQCGKAAFSCKHKSCSNNVQCAAQWETGEWKACVGCHGGEKEGMQKRNVGCYLHWNETRFRVGRKRCEISDGPRPIRRQTCGCPEPQWVTGSWQRCTVPSGDCGIGTKIRQVSCMRKHGSTNINRPVKDCIVYIKGEPVTPIPTTRIPCRIPCTGRWIALSWSKCSVTCGEGWKMRLVSCVLTATASTSTSTSNSSAICPILTRPKSLLPCNSSSCHTFTHPFFLRSIMHPGK